MSKSHKRHGPRPPKQIIPRTTAWLRPPGGELPAPAPETEARPGSFYQAFAYADDSQGIIIVLWYADRRQQRVRGLSFLVDFNPPWDGAVKDIIVFPSRSPQQALGDFVDSWRQRGMPLRSLAAAEARRQVLQSLDANRRADIRLPRDLIRARAEFLTYVLALPDAPDALPFTAQDFDRLAREGQTPESIMHYEQTVGRRVRLPDGKELLVMGAPLGDDDLW